MKTPQRLPVLAVLALAGALLAPGCGQAPPPAMGERPPVAVTAFPVVTKDVPLYIDEVGRAVASAVVELQPEVSGRITEVLFTDGADLKAKAELFKIDSRPFDARLAEAEARSKAADAGVVLAQAARDTAAARITTAKSKRDQAKAQTTWARAMSEASRADTTAAEAEAVRAIEDEKRFQSVGSGAVSQTDLARVKAEADAARARLGAVKRREAAALADAAQYEAAERSFEEAIAEAQSLHTESSARVVTAEAAVLEATAAAQSAALDVERCTVKAPLGGRAGRRLVDVGDVVEANATTLLVIQALDPAHIEFSVQERDLVRVQRHMGNGTALKAEVRLPDDPETREGELAFLDNAVEPGTGTVRLRVTIANKDGRFWPGLFVRVRLLLDTLKGALLVPAAAPQVSPQGLVVYVVGADGTAQMRPVKLGQRQGDLVVVDEGLAAGDRVIVDRNLTVFPGAKVIVAEPPTAEPAR